ncbi:hypothetical protein V6N11_038362 [Hibiscus sabdariffa]|uniref:Protein kinase domain-containing protein n=1 Tax=Hibiscus sabdariffa TaxID=183260 RepID=A0ABR2SJT8_9ROSI
MLSHLMAAFALFLILLPDPCLARHCGSVFCGSLNISYPFRLKNQPRHCGCPGLELECERNNPITSVLGRGKFSVKEIFYENNTLRVVDAGLDMDDCNSLPLSSVHLSSSSEDTYNPYYYLGELELITPYVMNCSRPIESSSMYIEASRCPTKSNTSSYFYFLDDGTPKSDFDPSCTVESQVPISGHNISAMTTPSIYKKLSQGFSLSYFTCDDEQFSVGVTGKIGEGGYGSVFKGKLRSGHHVAVKVLGKSKGDGQDFMNEVVSIGGIHHVNVAKLIGFCAEGSKQAFVYDFMSNGSLDKIIFTEENKNTLGWKKMFDIVLGVARGIDYLHRGCDMQILHFDIKPHNILLDKNFNSKVSDFDLAKLYSVDDSIVSLTAARGTIGYIAPELVYKNLGGISYKADVYSFGMLLMEMVGRRKNVNAFADHSSQIYFPSWIYDRLDQGEDMELGDVSEDEKVMVRKMIITVFWCIQLQPTDRPSMSKVLRMLESDLELLEMPPKPFHQLPLDTSSEVHGRENTNDEASTSPEAVTITGSKAV